jgi:hypothetical protein
MAGELLWISRHPAEAREQALRGRELVVREWSRRKAFGDLERTLRAVAAGGRASGDAAARG